MIGKEEGGRGREGGKRGGGEEEENIYNSKNKTSGGGTSSGSRVSSNYHVSLFCFYLEQFFGLPLFLDLDILEVYKPTIL